MVSAKFHIYFSAIFFLFMHRQAPQDLLRILACHQTGFLLQTLRRKDLCQTMRIHRVPAERLDKVDIRDILWIYLVVWFLVCFWQWSRVELAWSCYWTDLEVPFVSHHPHPVVFEVEAEEWRWWGWTQTCLSLWHLKANLMLETGLLPSDHMFFCGPVLQPMYSLLYVLTFNMRDTHT